MPSAEYERLRASFLRAFSSVPDPLRSQIIIAIGGRPYTWESVFVEVNAGTDKSKKMLEELKKLKIID